MKKSVLGVVSVLTGAAIGATGVSKVMGGRVDEWRSMSDKHLALFLLMNQWVKVKQEGKSLTEYFEREGYKEIAIYGMSYAGETLVNELLESGIKIKYGIDKKANAIYSEFDVVSPDDDLEDVDVIVVTPITFFDEIEEVLSEKISCPIVSLEDILYEI